MDIRKTAAAGKTEDFLKKLTQVWVSRDTALDLIEVSRWGYVNLPVSAFDPILSFFGFLTLRRKVAALALDRFLNDQDDVACVVEGQQQINAACLDRWLKAEFYTEMVDMFGEPPRLKVS
ncbi:hypothetical protein [Roseibium sp. TrichSKD4]|uniref:hypothetical protein n=1 Tax=Roseibium sp. TrichSKD4 TaxID=744980 RepID=UPI0002DB97A9|nr:hypothetical protein [Roseibium sp. TrichSKD4]